MIVVSENRDHQLIEDKEEEEDRDTEQYYYKKDPKHSSQVSKWVEEEADEVWR